MKHKTLFFLLLLFVSCGNPTVNPFSAALNNLTDQVKQIINQAQNAGLVLEVTAGAQILNTITQAQQAYEDGLIKGSDALSSQEQTILNGLNGSVDNLNKHVLQGLTGKVQSIANTIPFSKTFPQVQSYSGTVTDGMDNFITIKLLGNFFNIGNEGYQAYIKVAGKTIENSIRTTSLITFLIPKSLIKKEVRQISYIPMSVTIPYKKGWFNTKANSSFDLILIVLPGMSPGSLVAIQNKSVDVRVDTIINTPAKRWDSGDGDVDLNQGFDVIPGWTIDVNSVNIHPVPGSEGGTVRRDWYDLGNASTPTWAGWHIKATHKNSPWGHNGAISVTLSYKAYKNAPQQRDFKKDTLNLKWGESRSISIEPLANWKIVYERFDGKHFEISSNIRNDPYLKFDQSGHELQISAVPYQTDLE